MAKDPAFLFYPGDWLGGTMGMTIEQKGAYMELLIFQFNNGSFTEAQAKQVLSICSASVFENIIHKFKLEAGRYFNARLNDEILKRKAFSESRRNNALHSKKTTKGKKKAYAKHMEDENENEDGNVIINKNEVIMPFNSENFKKAFQLWIDYKKQQFNFRYKAIGLQGCLKDIGDLSGGDEGKAIELIHHAIKKGWKGIFQLTNNQNGKHINTASTASVRASIGDFNA